MATSGLVESKLFFAPQCGDEFDFLRGFHAAFQDHFDHNLIADGEVFQLGRGLRAAVNVLGGGINFDDGEVAALLLDFDQITHYTVDRTEHQPAVFALGE